MTFEDGLEAVHALRGWYEEHHANRNEATTRLHLIDSLFLDCLGWTKDEMVLEEEHGGEYADYTFLLPRRTLIIEAKREGIDFEVPAGKSRIEMSIPVLNRLEPAIGNAIKQAAGYCQRRGVPFGAVSNGHQLIAFLASRNDAVPPLDGQALVFSSIEEMEANFTDLWNALSKEGVRERRLILRLTSSVPSIPQKLSATVVPYPGVIQRNVLQNELLTLSGLILEDIVPSPELEAQFLRECYSQSGQLSQFSLASKEVLQSRYAAMFPANSPSPFVAPAVTRQGVSEDMLSLTIGRQPILLLGDVGVGKTTFIRNLIKVDAASVFENAIALHLNLGSEAALETDLRRYVQQEIEEQLREDYQIDIFESSFVRATYAADLKRFERSVAGELQKHNPELYQIKQIEELGRLTLQRVDHIKRSLEQITQNRRKQVVVFLDNADQRDDSTQEAAFLIAQEISQRWPALVFVSLRPETFNRSLKRGALTGYHPKAFTISPPRIDQAIQKRLRFALKITRGKVPVSRLQHVGIKLENLTTIVLIILQSLEYDPSIFELLDNLSGGNIRAALVMLTAFIGSGHVNTKKMIDIYETSNPKKYYIPPHEFMRAVIYGDSIHFDPSRSLIANVFDISSNDRREHFLLPLLLGSLERFGSTSSNSGFVESKQLYDSLQNMGFSPDQIDFAVARAVDKKLVQMSGRPVQMDSADLASSMRITSPGLYHAIRLAGSFYYIDAVIVDTPILDDSVREKVRNVQPIGDRLARAEIFIKEYLDPAWESIAKDAIGFDWSTLSVEAVQQIEDIRWKLVNRSRRL
ncbi:MAG: hypothetical protein P4K86_12170 [Terracidiphilus sp.]|nr:hypothetical protein [Terracidiphilus sp.]MDR3777392.1 hypothetical protein [Terracidiphilus sp.]